jgi:hypothetical protein
VAVLAGGVWIVKIDKIIVYAIIILLFVCVLALIFQSMIDITKEVAQYLQATILGPGLTFLAAAWKSLSSGDGGNKYPP